MKHPPLAVRETTHLPTMDKRPTDVPRRSFIVRWSAVLNMDDGARVFALWPSPMNDDICFREAGFSDFADPDEAWHANATDLLTRLLEALAHSGQPRLTSKPVEWHQSWLRRLFSAAEVADLRQQIELATQGDELPDCIVAFGESGVSLRTGKGHHMFWITVPFAMSLDFPAAIKQVAGPHPLVRTDLKWDGLL